MSPSPFNPLGPAHYNPDLEMKMTSQPAKRVGVFYATRQGQTKRIAERIAADLRALEFDVDLLEVRRPIPFALGNYSAAVLAASVHGGKHEAEMVRFVKEHRTELERMPSAFLSVTLSEAGAERKDAAPAEHARFVRDVETMLSRFFNETKWTPARVKPVAGALLYSRYNFLLRLVMRNIAKRAGAETDTSRDYVYTDWIGLDKFVGDFAVEIAGTQTAAAPPGGQLLAAAPTHP